MRIALDLRCVQDRYPGIGRYAYNLAAALPGVAPDVGWVYLHDPRPQNTRFDVAGLARLPGVEMQAVRLAVRSAGEQVALPRLAGRLGVNLWHAPYYVLPYGLGVPMVLTLYDAIARRYPETLAGTWRRPLFEALTRLGLRSARRFAAISAATRDDFVRLYGIDAGRISITPLGVDSRFVPLPEPEIARAVARLALARPYVLYLASNKPHKNLPMLLQAWGLAVSGCGLDGWRLVVAGHWDPRFPEARELSGRLGLGDSVQFLGEVAEQDLPALYAGASLFVLPSLYEGFGLPVLEAMACGVPVLCSDASSMPELAGDAALVLDPRDAAGWARAMRTALADDSLRAGLRAKGLRRAAEFTWERTARLTLETYHAALAKREPAMAPRGANLPRGTNH